MLNFIWQFNYTPFDIYYQQKSDKGNRKGGEKMRRIFNTDERGEPIMTEQEKKKRPPAAKSYGY